jgi:hypothetical protein
LFMDDDEIEELYLRQQHQLKGTRSKSRRLKGLIIFLLADLRSQISRVRSMWLEPRQWLVIIHIYLTSCLPPNGLAGRADGKRK